MVEVERDEGQGVEELLGGVQLVVLVVQGLEEVFLEVVHLVELDFFEVVLGLL